MELNTLSLYFMVAFLYIISPGPAVLLAIVNGIKTNMKVVLISSLANASGLFILSTASILGLGVLLMTSAALFMFVKIVGALYLIYLGFKFLVNKNSIEIDEDNIDMQERTKRSYFFESFFIAVTNPKPIIFFTAIFPQFLDFHSSIAPQFFILTGIFLVLSVMALCSYAYIFRKSKKLLSNEKRISIFNKITGGIFILLGIGLLKVRNHAQ